MICTDYPKEGCTCPECRVLLINILDTTGQPDIITMLVEAKAKFKAFLVEYQGCYSLANLPAIQKYFNLDLAEMIRIFKEVEKA